MSDLSRCLDVIDDEIWFGDIWILNRISLCGQFLLLCFRIGNILYVFWKKKYQRKKHSGNFRNGLQTIDCMRFFKFSSQIRFKSIFCKFFYVLDSLEPNLAVQKRLDQKLSLFRSAKFGSRSFIVKLYHFRDFPCPRAFLNFWRSFRSVVDELATHTRWSCHVCASAACARATNKRKRACAQSYELP